MIDQRVSEGIKCSLFNKQALTTTIPAQFVKKYGANIVPIYIERIKDNNFKIKIYKTLKFSNNDTLKTITIHLNKVLEEMIIKNLSNGFGHIIAGNNLIFLFSFN